MSARDPSVQQRARETFELFEVAVSLVRARLRREHPDATDQEIDEFVREWLVHESGGALGDPPPEGFRLRRIER
jgi:hypothetical protein